MSVPSKQELKQKYQISNEDFQVLTDLPSENQVREKGFLVKVGEAFGAEEWMWKTWTGVLVAIIIIAPQFQSTLDYWKPKVTYSVGRFYDHFRHLPWPLAPSDEQLFVPNATFPPTSTQFAANVPAQFASQVRYHFREHFPDTMPGHKRVSAPATESELLPLSQVVSSARGLGRATEGTVSHLPYRFRVSVFDPYLTVEAYHGDHTLEGFPQTARHSFVRPSGFTD